MTHIRLPSSCGLVVAPIQKDTDSKGSVRVKEKINQRIDPEYVMYVEVNSKLAKNSWAMLM